MKKRAFILFFLLVTILLAAFVPRNSFSKKEIISPPINLSENMPQESSLPSFSDFKVHYIDVGQADASLICCDGETMLIDGGNKEDSNLIVAYLKKLEIDHLDYMLCTHAHEDHVGGLSGPLSVMEVKTIYAPKTEAASQAYLNFKTKAQQQGITITHPAPGDTISLGSSTVQFLGPVTEETSNINNTSLVVKITYGSTSFLFTGDAERQEELDIVNAGFDLSATVLKVGHHGSEESTSYVFLREAMPQYGIISVGKNNSYGHPTEAVLSRLRDADVQVFRTDLQGDIIAASDGTSVTITPSRNETIPTNPTAVNQAPDDFGREYIGNKNTKKFHLPTCYTLPQENNRVYFTSREQAVSEGYSPCGNCRP